MNGATPVLREPASAGRVPMPKSSGLWPLATALVIALAIDMLPRVPLDDTFDASWAAVLSYAHERRLQFGSDIVFTYGPLGFAANPYFTGAAAGLRMVIATLFSFWVAAGVCLCAWRLGRIARTLLLCVFVFAAANVFRQAELCCQAGLLCWGLLCLLPAERPRVLALAGCTLLCIFGVLAKFTFLLAGVFTMAAIMVSLFFRRKALWALGAGVTFVIGVVLAWLLLGQALASFIPYLTFGFCLAGDYGQTMFLEPLPGSWRRAVAVAAVGTVYTLWSVRRAWSCREKINQQDVEQSREEVVPEARALSSRPELLVLLVWLLGMLFLAWKYGAVIPDREHLQVLFAFSALLVFVLEALPGESGRLWARLLALACLFLSLTTLQWLLPLGPAKCMAHPFRMVVANFRSLVRPNGSIKVLTAAGAEERARQALPALKLALGQSRVDVFGSRTSFALVNGFNYAPRPVFQSYAAYNLALMRLNEDFYSSPEAPSFVLFELAPLLRRLPALEDAFVLRQLLINYRPVETEGRFLLLRSNACERPRLVLLREGTARLGELISLSGLGQTNLWMEIEVSPNWRGWVKDLLWQGTRLRLGVWQGSRRVRTFRAPAPMLSAGFLANPLLVRNADVRALYGGESRPPVDGYSVEVNPGTENLWQPKVRYRLHAITNQLGGRETNARSEGASRQQQRSAESG